MPSKCKSGGEKRRQNSKVTAKSATTQISEKKGMVAESAIKMEKWWRKTPSNKQSDGRKCHYFSNLVELQPHISNCCGALTTTYHIQGAGAPAKTKNNVNADAFIFFREKVRPFPHLVSGWKKIIEKIDVLRIDVEKFIEYPAAMISEAFEFGEMEYFSRIKMFNRMLDKLGLI